MTSCEKAWAGIEFKTKVYSNLQEKGVLTFRHKGNMVMRKGEGFVEFYGFHIRLLNRMSRNFVLFRKTGKSYRAGNVYYTGRIRFVYGKKGWRYDETF